MKLSTKARYGLRMMLDVANHGGREAPVSLTAVAERTELSRGYLEQLALSLRNARLLNTVPGRKGGYMLAKRRSDVSVADIVGATIGPVCIVHCIDNPAGCPRTTFCEARLVWMLVNERIAEVLKDFSLADLLDAGCRETMREQIAQGPGKTAKRPQARAAKEDQTTVG